MKYLFITYCFGRDSEQSLIGVYKRGLRVAFELYDRGHEILFFCTGRDGYQDELTDRAEEHFHFVDLPSLVTSFETSVRFSNVYREAFRQLEPDVVVIGEAPVAGVMLEGTLVAAELGVPVVILDNVYNGGMAEIMCERTLGPITDGMVLTGPSALYTAKEYSFLHQIPPFIQPDTAAAKRLLIEEAGLTGEHLITILAYDDKVEQVGLSLLAKLSDPACEALLITRHVDTTNERLSELPADVQARIGVVTRQPEEIFFGLLVLSQLSVVKYGFMQVTECLALHTPVVIVFHEGNTWLQWLPESCQQFTVVTESYTADEAVVDAAKSFLDLDLNQMQVVHDGTFDAAERAADVLENLPTTPRLGTESTCDALGFSTSILMAALEKIYPLASLALAHKRCLRTRTTPEFELYSIICQLTIDGQAAVQRLWGRKYHTYAFAEASVAEAEDSPRSIHHYAKANNIVIEEDLGEAELPSLAATPL